MGRGSIGTGEMLIGDDENDEPILLKRSDHRLMHSAVRMLTPSPSGLCRLTGMQLPVLNHPLTMSSHNRIHCRTVPHKHCAATHYFSSVYQKRIVFPGKRRILHSALQRGFKCQQHLFYLPLRYGEFNIGACANAVHERLETLGKSFELNREAYCGTVARLA
jgi:hypothetical protein